MRHRLLLLSTTAAMVMPAVAFPATTRAAGGVTHLDVVFSGATFFAPTNERVLMQQGRVRLDADIDEPTAFRGWTVRLHGAIVDTTGTGQTRRLWIDGRHDAQ